MDDIKIEGLYKIFGPSGATYVDAVKNGLSKSDLIKNHGHVLGLKDVNLTIEAGKIQVVMGLSGSGKSTLIRHINRLIDPTVGKITYQGVDVCEMSDTELQNFRRHKTAMVFQKFALLPHRRVIDNAAYGLMVQGVAKREAHKKAEKWVARVGLDGLEDQYPNQLSGGMQQRVGLARALTNDADILLMDEAFSALDPLIRIDMQSVLLDLQKELGKTIVFITHDLDEAIKLGDNIAILRDGAIIQKGTGQDIVLNPADDYIRNFVKDVNRGRVLTAGTVMAPDQTLLNDAITVNEDTYIEQVIKHLVEAKQSQAQVTDGSGQPVGHLSLHSIVEAMVTPE